MLKRGDIVKIRATGYHGIVGKPAADGTYPVLDTSEIITYHRPAELEFILRVPVPVPFMTEIDASV